MGSLCIILDSGRKGKLMKRKMDDVSMKRRWKMVRVTVFPIEPFYCKFVSKNRDFPNIY